MLTVTQISTAYNDGCQEGIEIGMEKGKIEISQNLLDGCIDPKIISTFTDLSIEKIFRLKKIKSRE